MMMTGLEKKQVFIGLVLENLLAAAVALLSSTMIDLDTDSWQWHDNLAPLMEDLLPCPNNVPPLVQ